MEMKCINCGEELKDIDDICYENARVDFKHCERCNADVEVIYNPRTMEMVDVTWKRK